MTDSAVNTVGSTVSGTRVLDAFGNARTAATGSLATSAIGFAGQYLESATGLYDMRARDYSSATGRFTANDPVAVPMGMPYVAGYSYAFNNPLTGIDASGNWTSNCGVFSQACDSYTFFANVIIGAAKAGIGILVGVVSWVVDPVGTAIGVANSCNAGFAQYGGNGPSFEGALQCVDNLNPIAGIRNDFTSSLSATNVQDSGQAFGTGLLGVGLTAAPFAKGILPQSAKCDTMARGTTGSPRFMVNSAGEILDTSRITIPAGKLAYLLKNPSKSGVFEDSMGFDEAGLDSALRSHLTSNFGSATPSVPMTGGGTKFTVRGPITGPTGQKWTITTAWGVDVDGAIRLITATP